MRKVVLAILIFVLCTPALMASAKVKDVTLNYQYAGAAFDPDQTYSNFTAKLKVFEKGDYTIVFWVTNGVTNQSVYMSVAKNNKWLFRGKKVYDIPVDFNSVLDNYVFAHNYLFYQDANGVSVVCFNLEDGKILTEKLLEKKDPDSSFLDFKYLSPISSYNKQGIIYGPLDNNQYHIYLESELSSPITIYDPKQVLRNELDVTGTVLSTKRDRIIFVNNLYTNVFDIKQKDMVYDNQGQDKNYQFGEAFSYKFYDTGKFYSVVTKQNVTSISTFDENFKKLSSSSYKNNEAYFTINNITVNKSSIHLWEFYEFKRSNSLKVETFNLQ